MEMPKVNWKFIPFFRSSANPGAEPAVGVPSTGLMGLCDLTGVLWVRLFGAAPTLPTAAGSPSSTPGAGVKASASAPAVALSKNNAISASWSYGDTAALAAPLTIVLRDGASGVGPILWSTQVGPILAGTSARDGIVWPPGFGPGNTAVNTALTLEFLTAPPGTGTQSVSLVTYQSGA